MEKPTVKLPRKECIGVYALSPKIFPHILAAKKKKSQVNLSYDILAPLASKSSVSAHDIEGRVWIDAESPAVLERRKTDVNKALRQMKIA